MEIFNPKNGVVIDINCPVKSIISDIVAITKEIDYVAGYKLGAAPVIRHGLKDIGRLIKL
jgi:hypothetical protein